MKLCKDCRFYKYSESENFDKCMRVSITPVPIEIRGYNNVIPSYCIQQREKNWLDARLLGYCGKEGRFFKARNEKSLEEKKALDKLLNEINKRG